MKAHVWDFEFGFQLSAPRSRRRKTVTQILRAAYRKHGRDRDTRRAVKRCLR
jgi:hypothetical protein